MAKTKKYYILNVNAYNDFVKLKSFRSGDVDSVEYEKDIEEIQTFRMGESQVILTEKQFKNFKALASMQ